MKFLQRLKRVGGRRLVIGIPFFWLFLFFLLPFVIVVKISFAEADVAIPPYTDVVSWADNQLTILLNMGNYLLLQEDELYIAAYLGSLKMAFVSTLLCLLIGYPMAYSIARANKETQTVLLLLIMMPTWTAILIRVYAWMGILSNNGLLNSVLLGIGVIDEPLQILNTNLAVYIGIVYSYLPFMVLPLYSSIEKLDGRLLEAARDLGANGWQRLVRIILPLTLPGIIAGCLLVFLPAMGMFYVSDLLGGAKHLLIGNLIKTQFLNSRDWPFGAAISVMLTVLMALLVYCYWRAGKLLSKKGELA